MRQVSQELAFQVRRLPVSLAEEGRLLDLLHQVSYHRASNRLQAAEEDFRADEQALKRHQHPVGDERSSQDFAFAS